MTDDDQIQRLIDQTAVVKGGHGWPRTSWGLRAMLKAAGFEITRGTLIESDEGYDAIDAIAKAMARETNGGDLNDDRWYAEEHRLLWRRRAVAAVATIRALGLKPPAQALPTHTWKAPVQERLDQMIEIANILSDAPNSVLMARKQYLAECSALPPAFSPDAPSPLADGNLREPPRLCDDCPPASYSVHTRCLSCPRRKP